MEEKLWKWENYIISKKKREKCTKIWKIILVEEKKEVCDDQRKTLIPKLDNIENKSISNPKNDYEMILQDENPHGPLFLFWFLEKYRLRKKA